MTCTHCYRGHRKCSYSVIGISTLGIVREDETTPEDKTIHGSMDSHTKMDLTPKPRSKRKRTTTPTESDAMTDHLIGSALAISSETPPYIPIKPGVYLSESRSPERLSTVRSVSHVSGLSHHYSRSPQPSILPDSPSAPQNLFSPCDRLSELPHPGHQQSESLASLSILAKFLISTSLLHTAESQRRALHRNFTAQLALLNRNFDVNADNILNEGRLLIDALDWSHHLCDEELARFYSVTDIFLKVLDCHSIENIPTSPIISELCKLVPRLRSIVEALHPGLEVSVFPERIEYTV